MEIKAKNHTFLKKTTEPASSLPIGHKVSVVPGKIYPIESIVSVQGLHYEVNLGHGAGKWFIFSPHWDIFPEKALIAKFTLKMMPEGSGIYSWGTLEFSDGFSAPASSGQVGYQYPGAEKVKRLGFLPPYKNYSINLPGYPLRTRGIEGMFWHLTPDPIWSRSELGIHKDANVLGSSGCIVIPIANFPKLEEYLKRQSNKYKQIKLEVEYLP